MKTLSRLSVYIAVLAICATSTSYATWVDDELARIAQSSTSAMTITSVTIESNYNATGKTTIWIKGTPAIEGTLYGSAYYVYNPSDPTALANAKVFLSVLLSAKNSTSQVTFRKGTGYQVLDIQVLQ